MTRREFTSKSDALSRKSAAHVLMITISGGIGILLSVWVQRRYGDDSIYNLLVLVPMVLSIGWMFWSETRLQGKLGLLCPHCGRMLGGSSVLMKGNCHGCGKSVFSEESIAPRSGGEPKVSESEFVARLRDQIRREKRRSTVLASVGIGAVGACYPFVLYLNHLTDLGRIGWMYPALWTVIGMVGILVLAVIGFLFQSARGKLKRAGVPCPSCRRPFSAPVARLTLTTGRCIYCGENIFEKV